MAGANPKADTPADDLQEKLVNINRAAKAVKGGRQFRFAALAVVGDGEGKVGFGRGKAREVPDGISKAMDQARKHMRHYPLHGDTLFHTVEGTHAGARVLLKPASPGTGIIAGGPVRAVMEVMGIKDVLAKSLGSSNPVNVVRATFDALDQMVSPEQMAAKRGKPVDEIWS
ncbi:30S ribosomal protein S5 [Thiohalorhabdus denitrificans]|uniref:Small ribosomal subunit protein uS5 n=1 Tax=Thiohalorhabdus denitrificans TaxID=381306 RepID=A0A0P9CWC6_9GAMM|nr:30S ribosomal protein S5 [Thiohalorhabdus denitrificans]KPV40971.1 30S ribosomal protein S5 [Thiohalorhabdus denitrificans]SCY43029.1 SSU ribosomal protein S5P [Thiohalorhabdus denitrificans]